MSELPAEQQAALYRSLVDDAPDVVVAIRPDLSVAFVGGPCVALLGWKPDEIVGRQTLEFIHEDDIERALVLIAGTAKLDAPSGAAGFRLRHRDGTWIPFDVTASRASDGVRDYMAVFCRPVDYAHATDEVLARLLRGADRAAALEPVLDVFSWEANDSHVAISWDDELAGRHHVSTGLPPGLIDGPDGSDSPWAHARATGEEVMISDIDELDPELAALARAHGRGAVWVVPVGNPADGPPALVTVWTRSDINRPDGHGYGMTIAKRYIELILRWTEQVSDLTRSARIDPLTNIGNRAALFDALGADEDGGALLFCDLDHFKAVNDDHGHAAGDRVLKEVAARISASVRTSDLVARSGGDEFIVLARGADTGQAAALAARIRAAVTEPIDVGSGDDAKQVRVGVTIGVAHAPDRFTEEALAGADRALLSAKSDDRGTVRWA